MSRLSESNMSFRHHMAAIVVSALLAACSFPRPLPPVDISASPSATAMPALEDVEPTVVYIVPSRTEVVCREVARTGSHIARRECFPRDASRRQSQEAREWLRSGGVEGSVSVIQ